MSRRKHDPDVFANEYVKDFDATAAFERSYGPTKTRGGTRLQAHKLMQKPEVIAAISLRTKERVQRIGFDADKILEEIARLAFSDISALFEDDGLKMKPWKDIDPLFRKAISSVEIHTDTKTGEIRTVYKVRLWDKLNALEKLGKHLRLFHDTKLEVSDADGGPLAGGDMSPIELARRVAFILNEGVRKKNAERAK